MYDNNNYLLGGGCGLYDLMVRLSAWLLGQRVAEMRQPGPDCHCTPSEWSALCPSLWGRRGVRVKREEEEGRRDR